MEIENFAASGRSSRWLAAGGAAYVVNSRVHAPFRGFAAPEQFVEIPAGAGHAARLAIDWSRPASIRDAMTYRAALWLSGERAAPEGGRVPVRSPDDAARRPRQDRARRRLRRQRHLPGRTARSPRWRRSSRRTGSARRAAFVAAARDRRARAMPSIRRRAISRAICFRTRIRCRAEPTRRSSCG